MLVERWSRILLALALCAAPVAAGAQQEPARPPAVGVVPVARQPITPSSEYIGRIQATDRVNLVARVAAFLDGRFFTEGAEVRKGDLLYRLEQGPFQADVEAKQAVVDQYKAQLRNADLTLSRAKTLLNTPAGQQSTVDAALANQLSIQAQMAGAQAQLEQSKINLGYTDIRAPIDGKIGRTAVTVGNYVTPSSGVLAAIVSQDPIDVVFPVAARTVIALMESAAAKGGFRSIVVKIGLPDGRTYDEAGALDFLDNTVAAGTDTITLRAVVANPVLSDAKSDLTARRAGRRRAGDCDPRGRAAGRGAHHPARRGAHRPGRRLCLRRRRRRQGAAAAHRARPVLALAELAVVSNGLVEGERVVLEGVQRVRPGQLVAPAPAASAGGASATQSLLSRDATR